jgi:CubicO group peptidase (beta-lactamase class C family)
MIGEQWLEMMVGATVRSALLIAAATVCAWALQRRAAAVRSFVWHITMCGVLLLPVLTSVLPRWRVDITRAVVANRVLDVVWQGRSGDELPIVDAVNTARGRERASLEPAARNRIPPLDWPALLFFVWLSGAAIHAARLLLSLARLRRLEIRACPAVDHRLQSLLASHAQAFHIVRPVRILEGPPHLVPITWGFIRPRLLLPEGWQQWQDGVLSAVIQHELAHVRRHDLAAQLLCDMAQVVFWFNPLIWLAARAAHLAREQACDDEVIERGLTPTAYAEALLALVYTLRGAARSPRPALAMGSHRELTRRIEALVDTARIRGRLSTRFAVGVSVSVTLATGVFAAMSLTDPRPAAASSPVTTTDLRAPVVSGTVGRSLDSAFTMLERVGLSGTVLVATQDRVVFAKGFGYADRARHIPATVATRYHTAGITKAFTAAAVVDLIDRGIIDAATPVSRYVPELSDRIGAITVHQLLTHTDGLADVHGGEPLRDAASFTQALNESRPAFVAGRAYGPGNAGHSLLALLVERVTAQPFDNYLRTRFFSRAEMTSSFLRDEGGMPLESVAVGYVDDNDERAVVPEADGWGVRGSRGLVSTAGDLYLWYLALRDGRLVSARAIDMMRTPHVRTAKQFEQSYGWLLYDQDSSPPFRSNGPLPLWRRSGREPGFEAELVHDPNGDWVAIVLLNSDALLRLRAVEAVRAVLNGQPPPIAGP